MCMLIIKKDMQVLGEGPTQGLDDTTLIPLWQFLIIFTQPGTRFVLIFHYNGSKSLLFVNAVIMNQLKAKDLEIES